MKTCKLLLLSGIIALSVIAVLPVYAATTPVDAAVERGTVVTKTVQSAHNYANNFDYTWTITQSGATSIRVYFYRYQVETNYDYVYVMDKNGAVSNTYTSSTSKYYVWSSWLTGDSAKIRLKTDSSVTYYGFQITKYEYVAGAADTTAPTTSITSPTSGATVSGTTTISASASDNVGVSKVDFYVDSVLKGTDTSSPYSYSWATTAYSNGAHSLYTKATDAAGNVGTSATISVTVSNAAADTTAPTTSITSPTSGATVSGTTTISASASDNVGVSKVDFYVDSVLKGTDTSSPYSYSWATTAYSNGAHSLYTKATDAAGNVGTSATISVTVSNTVTDDGGLLTAGVTANGNMDSADVSDMFWIDVPANTASMYVVLTCGTFDFDTYGKFNAQPTTSVYDWRGYTSGGEENTVTSPSTGRHYIMVQYYSGAGAYQLIVTLTAGGGGGGGDWGTGGKYAVIVGISNYASINDLSFCDEDALDWYNFLVSKGYECHVFYDGSYTSNSFTSIPAAAKIAQATEANVRAAIQGLAAHAVSGNSVAFVTSGHGSGDGAGSSYLCMYDCSGSVGCYYDTELKADFNLFVSGVKMFVFVDHCYSGGLGPEMLQVTNAANLYMTTTCTANGYGYDDSAHSNGAWTYYFLENYLVSHSTSSMEAVFDAATPGYPYTGGDAPMEFDGNTGSAYYL
jgi:hypothetical protein